MFFASSLFEQISEFLMQSADNNNIFLNSFQGLIYKFFYLPIRLTTLKAKIAVHFDQINWNFFENIFKEQKWHKKIKIISIIDNNFDKSINITFLDSLNLTKKTILVSFYFLSYFYNLLYLYLNFNNTKVARDQLIFT